MESRVVVTLRWSTVSPRFWIPATILNSWRGRCADSTRTLACVSTKMTSMSANPGSESRLSCSCTAWSQEYWGNEKKWAKGGKSATRPSPVTLLLPPPRPLFPMAVLVQLCTLSDLDVGCRRSDLFCASRDCRNCSSSLMKSMAPPTIEAWSPWETH